MSKMSGQKRDYFKGSCFVAWGGRLGRRMRSATEACSEFLRLEELRESPVRMWSLAVVTAVLTNGGLLWLWQRPVGVLGIVLRGLLLLAGLLGLNVFGNWRVLRSGSVLIRFFSRKGRG